MRINHTQAHYIDAVAFTSLFREPEANHDQICVGLRQIAEGVGRRFKFPTVEDRSDAVAEVTCRLIARIGKFDRSRGNAFSLFTTAAVRLFINESEKVRRHHQWARTGWNLHGYEVAGGRLTAF